MWRFALTIALVAVLPGCSCRPDRIQRDDLGLRVVPNPVAFPRTFLGYPTTANAELRNTGRSPQMVRLSTSGPFSTDEGPMEVAGGAAVQLVLRFTPVRIGEAEGTLSVSTVELNSTVLRVTADLVASAEAVPDCPASACQEARFNAEAGVCVVSAQPNGTMCEIDNRCLLNGRCSEGVCEGQAVQCDDRNACTTDVCDRRTGCVFFPSTATCGSSTDPCKVPACDPVIGCTFVEAQDGLTCGPSDCSTAQICLRGVCQRVPVNDGAACGQESPCQSRGQCAAGVCVQPPPTELTPSWTRWAGPDLEVVWDSLGDVDGNVYWRETPRLLPDGGPPPGPALLVSVTKAGFSRYAVPIPRETQQVAIIEGLLLLKVGPQVQARSRADGSLRWSRLLGSAGSWVRTMARGIAGVAYVSVEERVPGPPEEVVSTIHALNLVDGSTRWQVPFRNVIINDYVTPVDENGYLYAGMVELVDGFPHRYVSLSPAGVLRWNFHNPYRNPAAVFGGRVYHWDHWLSETSTGAWVNAEPPTLLAAGYPRLALGAVSYVGTQTDEVTDCDGGTHVGTRLQLVRVDPPTSRLRWSLEIAGPDAGGLAMTNTSLTSQNAVLFSQAQTYCGNGRHVLREVSAFGQPNFACLLPAPEAYWGEGLLLDGLWVSAIRNAATNAVGVRAFSLPELRLPEHGWATAWGSPARDGHSR